MPQQEKRDKIICALYKMRNDFDSEIHEPTGSPPEDVLEGYKATIDEVVEMLNELEPKIKEPRVMKFGEMRKHNGIMYIEDRDWILLSGIYDGARRYGSSDIIFVDYITWLPSLKARRYCDRGHHCFIKKEYGKTWRCWTSKPTNEQMKAVKWK